MTTVRPEYIDAGDMTHALYPLVMYTTDQVSSSQKHPLQGFDGRGTVADLNACMVSMLPRLAASCPAPWFRDMIVPGVLTLSPSAVVKNLGPWA